MVETGVQLQRVTEPRHARRAQRKWEKSLVRLCDAIEKHGLVDYQYGVWEEQIIASKCCSSSSCRVALSYTRSPVLEECLDLGDRTTAAGGAVAGVSSSQHR